MPELAEQKEILNYRELEAIPLLLPDFFQSDLVGALVVAPRSIVHVVLLVDFDLVALDWRQNEGHLAWLYTIHLADALLAVQTQTDCGEEGIMVVKMQCFQEESVNEGSITIQEHYLTGMS